MRTRDRGNVALSTGFNAADLWAAFVLNWRAMKKKIGRYQSSVSGKKQKKNIYKYCARVSELPFPPSRRSFTSYHFIGIGPYFEFLIIIRCGVLIMLFEPWIGSYAEQFFFLVPFAIFHGVIRMLFPLLPLFFPVDTMPLLWWYNSTLRIDTLLQCSMRASRLAETSKYAHSKQRHQIVCAIVNLFLIQSSTQHDGRKMLENATLIN